ncbi:MAG: PhnD/SsuA/transferrin family substrate-binding protein [Desulfobacteraceae bacterium]
MQDKNRQPRAAPRNCRIKTILLGVALQVIPLLWTGAVLCGEVLDFVVIQPGQPGDAESARPVMEALAAYVQKGFRSKVQVEGRYFNRLDPALAFLQDHRPAWGIVSPGFYVQEAARLNMTPIASTRPGGHETDVWRLMATKDGNDQWRTLTGTVSGSMLFETRAAACLLFGVPARDLPFTLAGTFRPLRALRKVAAGTLTGAVLDRRQYEAVQRLPLARKIKVIHTSGPLPPSPVVWRGPPDKRTGQLTSILLGMKADKDAQSLLRLLQTDGFARANRPLPRFAPGQETGCFP